MTYGISLPDTLYLIIDASLSNLRPEEVALQALSAGVRLIQYRDKRKPRREIYSEAKKLRQCTKEFGATFIVNDHADIAAAINADGVHLGQEDLPLHEARKIMGKKLIGISTHSLREAIDATVGGADYIGFGPIFFTSTKETGPPQGVAMVREVKRHIAIPVVAIGGISRDNVLSVLDAGADVVAVASAILKGDIAKNIPLFREVLRRFRKLSSAQ
jgi:thiamine-phosphate pyrophosphorylase